MTRKILILCFVILYACSKNDDRLDELGELSRPNCGKIIRIWSQNTSFEEGNPCGDNNDYSRRFTFVVRNQVSDNIKNFCVNFSTFGNYRLEEIFCDNLDPNGW